MPYRHALIADLKLNDVQPFTRGGTLFTCDLDGKLLIVRVDNAAVSKLLGDGPMTGDIRALLMERHDLVCEAAQRLLRSGYWTESVVGVVEVEVTVLDL